MHGPYQFNTWSDLNHCPDRICTACGQPAIWSKLSCVLQLQSSQLQVTDAAFYSRLQASHTMHTELDLRNITIQTRLFKIFGIWPQTDIHTHACAQCSHASVGLAQARPGSPQLHIPEVLPTSVFMDEPWNEATRHYVIAFLFMQVLVQSRRGGGKRQDGGHRRSTTSRWEEGSNM